MSISLFIYYCKYYEEKFLRQRREEDLSHAINNIITIYQNVLLKCGHFIDSGKLWSLYFSFLERYSSNQTNPPLSQKCIALLREGYQKVISLPIYGKFGFIISNVDEKNDEVIQIVYM